MIHILKTESQEFLDENEKKILNEYSQLEQEQQLDSVILEDDTILDHNLAKILLVAIATTTLFFLKNS